MDNFNKRRELLVSVIDRAIDSIDIPRIASYTKTKQFCYEAINRYFIGRNVLELGSDESPTTSILARWSKKLTVVDREDKFSKKILGDDQLGSVKFIQSSWEDFSPEEKFSDIVLTDSLEHVEDPVQILSLCKGWLAENGRLHIVVPNALSLHRLLGVEMGMLDTPYDFNQNDVESDHLRVYDTLSLKADIKKSGLSLFSLKGIQLKPMTDSRLADFPLDYTEALNSLSDMLPNYCAEIYACCIG